MLGWARRVGWRADAHILGGARAWALRLALLWVFASPGRANAADVEVCAQEPTNDTVSEALVRVRAELTAAGFTVEKSPCGEVPVDLGRIEFVLQEARLEITASSLASNSTMIQVANLTNKAITPEVVAVRAVDSLRAVLLQSLRSGELKLDAVSLSVREFTQFKSPEEKVAPPPQGLKADASRRTESPTSPQPAPHARQKEKSPLGLLMSVGDRKSVV